MAVGTTATAAAAAAVGAAALLPVACTPSVCRLRLPTPSCQHHTLALLHLPQARNPKGNGNRSGRRYGRSQWQPRAAAQPDTIQPLSSKPVIPDTEISITKTSFGTIGLAVGTSLLGYGFGAYFTVLPGAEWSAIMLTYGFPLAIIGMALKYAELKPVPCITYADAYALRDSQATPILAQVRSDVTRYRYGDEQHLEEALKRIFRYGLAGGIQRRNAPTLQSIREEVSEKGYYTLVLVFQATALKLEDFVSRQAKFTSFFGPGVSADIVAAGDANVYEVRLVAQEASPAPAPASPSASAS